LILASPLLAAGEAATASSREQSSVPTVANAHTLPAISIMVRDPLQAEEPPAPAQAERFDDSPLDIDVLLLAAWLPIAGALLALVMEGPGPKVRRARAPGGEPSLD
jgi:hypothetical protein